MIWMFLILLCQLVLIFFPGSTEAVTVYGQQPLGATSTTPGAKYTGLAAYDPTVLNPPPLPTPAPAAQYTLQLAHGAGLVQGLSIPQVASFFGFSIEVSVINQILGKNSSFLQVPFLNLLANHVKRSGEVHIRVGGNTQDYAFLVDKLNDGKILQKMALNSSNPTDTPMLMYTRDMFYLMNNISSFVNVKWYLGIPLNDTQNLRLAIAEEGERILGGNIIGFQVGNEPDLYARHGHRPSTYAPSDYVAEFGTVVNAVNANNNIQVKNNLIGPSLATADWQPQQIWDTGFITTYANNLKIISVEHYPTDNCFAVFGPTAGSPHDLQETFASFLTHQAAKDLVSPYLVSTALAQSAGKPFIMMETNTASCGGFPGISDSFGAALWALDFGLQMAAGNFSEALLHVGGQNNYYNPFTAPPTNQSEYYQWTVGSIFYPTLVIAEAFGTSGTARVIDLNANSGDLHTPAYAIYENDVVAKVAIFNFMTDSTGASDSHVNLTVGGGTSGEANGTPAQVRVKYLAAPSVSEKANITWAGQGFGGKFSSDGIFKGEENIVTVACDQNANTCQIHVPAPGFALVFLTDDPSNLSNDHAHTYTTTAYTKTWNTVRVDPSVLATSNGQGGKDRRFPGSTSFGSKSGAMSAVYAIPTVVVVLCACVHAIYNIGWL